MHALVTPNLTSQVSHMFSSMIRCHHVYKRDLDYLFFHSSLAQSVNFSFWQHHFGISCTTASVLFLSAAATVLENGIVALMRHDQVSFYAHGAYTIERGQAWIQDRHLLQNLGETPCLYLWHAIIQIRLLFKDLRYLANLAEERWHVVHDCTRHQS